MKTLYVAWEDPEDRSWMPVGRLTVTEQGTYRFNYTKGAEMSKRFTPFVKLDELDAEYESDELFPIFRNRIVHETLALALRTVDPPEIVGYCPRYFCEDFHKLIELCGTDKVVVTIERVNTDAPIRLRLLCCFTAPWPDGFQPCSHEKYRSLCGQVERHPG